MDHGRPGVLDLHRRTAEPPFITGTFEAANGHWKTKTAVAPLDEGPFHFIDADTISMTGTAGQEVIWRRAKECAAIRRR